jgi:hypothetical protein
VFNCELQFNGEFEVKGVAVSGGEINFCEISLVLATAVLACKKMESMLACLKAVLRAIRNRLEKEVNEHQVLKQDKIDRRVERATERMRQLEEQPEKPDMEEIEKMIERR